MSLDDPPQQLAGHFRLVLQAELPELLEPEGPDHVVQVGHGLLLVPGAGALFQGVGQCLEQGAVEAVGVGPGEGRLFLQGQAQVFVQLLEGREGFRDGGLDRLEVGAKLGVEGGVPGVGQQLVYQGACT